MKHMKQMKEMKKMQEIINMRTEIDLLKNYPRTKRDPGARGATKTEEDRAIARQFGKDFFDGDITYLYGRNQPIL